MDPRRSSTRRSAARAAIIVASVTVARPLSADEGPPRAPPARLVYTRDLGVERCPNEASLRTAVASRLGYDPFRDEADRSIVARVRRAARRLEGSVEMRDRRGAVAGARRLSASLDDCDELVASMALAISLAVDPRRALQPPPPPSPPPSPPSPAPPPPPAPVPSIPAPPEVPLAMPLPVAVTPPGRAEPLRAPAGGVQAQYGVGVAVDAQGNVGLIATLDGSADFGGGVIAGADATDTVVAKYSVSGQHLWSRRFGGPLDQIPEGIAADQSGNWHVVGSMSGPMDAGGTTLVGQGGADLYVLELVP